jgi:hypothetical protein
MQHHITVSRLPGSYTGAVAYDWRTGKLSVSDGPSLHANIQSAVDGLRETNKH